MEVEFGTSSRPRPEGKQTVIYRNFEYVKERDKQNGTTAGVARSIKVCSAKPVSAIFHTLRLRIRNTSSSRILLVDEQKLVTPTVEC